MPITIDDLAVDRKTVTLELGSGSLTVTYRPNALTPAREMFLLRAARAESEDEEDAELQSAERNITRQISTFVELVESWDFLGPLASKNGERLDIPRDQQSSSDAEAFCELHGAKLVVPTDEPVPIKADVLRLLPSHFLMRVVVLINQDMRPNPKQRKGSKDG